MSTLQPKVIYEDHGLLALDKPAGLLAHGEEGQGSALSWAREREAARGGAPEQLLLVHRLDRETSGVLLLARGADLAEQVNAEFRERRVLKVYLALASPVPPLRWLRIEQRLVPERLGAGERMRVVQEGGVEASSEIEVLSRGRQLALVRVIPEQGRKHQVRVALASAGAPIAGDFLYGGNLSKRLAKRVMLHARTLELRHPKTQEHLVLRAPLPADFRTLIAEDAGTLPADLDVRHRVVEKPIRGPQLPGRLGDKRQQALAEAVPAPRELRRRVPKKGASPT